jgi:hypothetical protein
MQLPHQDMAAWSSCPWKKRFTGPVRSNRIVSNTTLLLISAISLLVYGIDIQAQVSSEWVTSPLFMISS